jgi:tRNA 2-thiouridine synthesizing protein A
MDSATAPARQLDLRGLKCPLPALRTRRALRGMAPGEAVRVECTDPLSVIDIPHFVAENGHELIEAVRGENLFTFLIRKGAG